MIGTLDYMSPEQMVGGICTPASDIYTLGVVMYEMIAGRKPFDDANSAAAALAAVLTSAPPRLALQAVVPADVDRIVMRCLERNHTDRYQSAAALAAALDEILSSGEEAVTTVDLSHARGVITTIAGMRLPAKLPLKPAELAPTSPTSLLGPPVVAAAGAAPVDRPTPVPPAAITAPVNRPDPRPPRLTPTPSPVAHAPLLHTAPSAPGQTPSTPRSIPLLPKLIADADRDAEPPDTTLIGHLPMTRAPASPAGSAAVAPPPLASGPVAASMPAPASMQALAAIPAPASAHVPAQAAALPQAWTHSSAPAPDVVAVPMLSLTPPRRQIAPASIESPTPRSLREAYPTIHRPPPSPMRPSAVFDDGRSSGIGAVFDMSRAVRRDVIVRRLVIAVGLAVVIAVAILIASRW
jgi:serine/threonine-protein kinase